MINWEMITVFAIVFVAVTLLSFLAAYRRGARLRRLAEWSAGRQFGTLAAWFLMGGTIFTGNSMIAIPALAFARGALGLYTVPLLTLVFPLLYVVLVRFWIIARHRGYLTAADFVSERFGRSAALLVALTGILATLPYVAVQIYAIEVALAQLGVPVEISLVIAFLLISLSTYIGGLRAPALMAIVKDFMLVFLLLAAWIIIPWKLGGIGPIFTAVHQKALQSPAEFAEILPPSQYVAYGTQVLGSALGFFLFPQMFTVFCSTNSHRVLKRNAIALLFYTLLIGMVTCLGYMAIAAGIAPSPIYKTNSIVPALFAHFFPAWFTGFALAAIVICALVPATIMSIGVANLFTRNIYREYLHSSCNEQEELRVARIASLLVKFGALAFILFVPTTFVSNFQLMGSVWIVQTLPMVFLGLYTRWFHRRALLLGGIGGIIAATWMLASNNFGSFYPITFGSSTLPIYAGLAALAVNLLLVVVLTPVLRLIGSPEGRDMTSADDFETRPVASQAPFSRDLASTG